MAINSAIIRIRRGLKDELQIDKLLPGELAMATDAPIMWFCWAPGNVEQVPTSENITEIIAEIIKEYLKDNPVTGISEIYMRVANGYIQYSSDNETWNNLLSIEDITGSDGKDGYSPSVNISKNGKVTTITIIDKNGEHTATINDGADGEDGKDGKTAYQYAQDGGYTGTEAQFSQKLAKEYPSKTSDLENDSGFISKAVMDLANYYLKTETYSQSEINQRLSAIPKFAIQVVTSLPLSGDSTTVYLLKSGDEESNLYTEYIYVNGEWEYLGSQSVDLNDYALAADIPTKLSDLTNDSEFITRKANNLVYYYNRTESDKRYQPKGDYLTEHQDLSEYAKKATTLSGYGITDGATKEQFDQLSKEKVDYIQLANAVNTALEQAKASGEFDGEDGADYVLTEADKEEIAEKVPYVKVAEHPICVNSIEEMTDTSKMYVLNSDGMFYSYKTKKITTEGSKVPNFTNLMDNPNAEILALQRYSLSGKAFKPHTGDSIVVPFNHKSGTSILRIRGIADDDAYGYIYFGTTSTEFTTSLTQTWEVASNGDIVYTITNSTDLNGYITFTVASGASKDTVIVTLNEEITYTVTEGGTEIITEWSSTGISYNQPADYEPRVISNEKNIESLKSRTASLENRLNSTTIEASGTTAFSTPAYAPVPQLPADGSSAADFHGLNITTEQAYTYMDALVNKHKGYVTKQTMGKDQSGAFDHNRYILCKAYWRAWLKPNYPMMFAWINGNTVIYSVSASPRVGETMYTTPYIGTAYSTVTTVNHSTPNATNGIPGTPSTRTVKGLVFTRHKSGDVEPTIVYTKVEKSISALNSGTVYNSSFGSLTKVTAYTKEAITCADGITYTRYPFEDLKTDKSKPLSIFILANEHGHHGDNKVPSIILMRMAKDLCENKENPFLQWMKENVMITMIPVGNPWGYDPSAGTSGAGYNNSRGVNINRNYDTPGWAGSDTNYGDTSTFGAYPGSENETQHIMNTMHLCKAKVGLSMHGLGLGQYKKEPTEYTDGLMWQGCGFDKDRMIKVAEVLFSDYGQLIGGHTSGDQSYQYCGKSPAYIQYVGAVGGLNEIPDYETGTLDLYTPTAMEAAYTQMLLFLQTWCEEALEKMS